MINSNTFINTNLRGALADFNKRVGNSYELLYYLRNATVSVIHDLNLQAYFSDVNTFAGAVREVYQSFTLSGNKGGTSDVLLVISIDTNGNLSPIYMLHQENVLTNAQNTSISTVLHCSTTTVSDNIKKLVAL